MRTLAILAFLVTSSAQAANGYLNIGTLPGYPSQSAARFFASPTGASGVPSFRSIQYTDFPACNGQGATPGLLGGIGNSNTAVCLGVTSSGIINVSSGPDGTINFDGSLPQGLSTGDTPTFSGIDIEGDAHVTNILQADAGLQSAAYNNSSGLLVFDADNQNILDAGGALALHWESSGVHIPGVLYFSGGQFSTPPEDHLPFQSPGILGSITSNMILGNGKVTYSKTIGSMQAVATSFTCTVNPVVTLYDCGTSAGACTSGRTAMAAVTLTAANSVTTGTVNVSTITSGHFYTFETTAGTCTALAINGSADAQSL